MFEPLQRIALLGAESSGKSSLAAALADHFGTVWVPEAARRLWTERGGHFSFEDMLGVACTQVADEEHAMHRARRFLFADTTPLTTLLYALDIYGKAEPELEQLSHRRYDHTFLCAPDIPFVQDGQRTDSAYRARMHDAHLAMLEARKIPYQLLTGSLEERMYLAGDTLLHSDDKPRCNNSTQSAIQDA